MLSHCCCPCKHTAIQASIRDVLSHLQRLLLARRQIDSGVSNIQMTSFSTALFSTFNIMFHKFIYSLLALVIQPWRSHEVSTYAQLPSYTDANLPPLSRRSPGLHDSFTANWLLLKEDPQGKQRALEILMPLTTLEKHPLQKPPPSNSHPLFSSFSFSPTLPLSFSLSLACSVHSLGAQ